MPEYTDHEKKLMELMTPQHAALMEKLVPKERKSMEQHVKPEGLKKIQQWMGSDKEIEDVLFWDRGGKFDDPVWAGLKPADQASADLYAAAEKYFADLKKEAVEMQRRSDLTLLSQFNSGLLLTGLAGAVRCDKDGAPSENGEFFRGVELRMIGSVSDEYNSISIMPLDQGGFGVVMGAWDGKTGAGNVFFTGDSHSLLQIAMLAVKTLPKSKLEVEVLDLDGKQVELDPKAIRKASMEGVKTLDLDELMIKVRGEAESIDEALALAGSISTRIYERLGLEIEAYKLGKKYGNFHILREENFDQWLPEGKSDKKAILLLTATLVCRRCRREIPEFAHLAANYPDVPAVLVNLSSPQFKFYERVFGDMGGGDADEFRKNAAGVTPFIIVYSADENGKLVYREYIATGKDEISPSLDHEMPAIYPKYFA